MQLNWTLRGRLAMRRLHRIFGHDLRQCHRATSAEEVPNRQPLELTLAIIKPHICKDPYSLQTIRQVILDDGFFFIRSLQKGLTTGEAQEFYKEHQGKFFYNRLVTFMTSGECCVHILARHNAIARWRQLMGPTKVYRTRLEHPETIRGRFGLSDTRNATHGSDSVESATKEMRFFFPEFAVKQWYEDEEAIYRNQAVGRWRSKMNNADGGVDRGGDGAAVEFDRRSWQHWIARG